MAEIPAEVLRIAEDIRSMRIRGAGRIARAAATALREAARSYRGGDLEDFRDYMERVSKVLLSTRPTAVSLPNAVAYVMKSLAGDISGAVEAVEAVVRAADEFIAYSERAVGLIAEIGSRILRAGDVVLTHCNSSATTSILLRAWEQGKAIRVIATETRPRFQGHITARELASRGVPVALIPDSAVAAAVKKADVVMVGADAITSNGALINKVGTSQVALAAKVRGVPFYVAAETYKFSPHTLVGEPVEIEERDPSEVLSPPPEGIEIRNPAFDATPPEYIDAIITELGIASPGMALLVISDHLGHKILGDVLRLDFIRALNDEEP